MRNNSGFSFIELLVTIVIISILVGVVGLSVLHRPGEARVAAARLQIRTFKQALQMYRMDQGQYPTQAQGLEALCVRPVRPPVPEHYPAEGYIDSRQVPFDPWNNPYIYLVPGRQGTPCEVLSYGADGEPGGEGEAADISSLDL
ncbi:MAG: type II secretion system major pseudopilin GspG [Kiritimatiellia bacterium]|nr:type II secretion system major pseudopilin GspG [Lentisphaerota bacterium]